MSVDQVLDPRPMERIDSFPTTWINGVGVRPGRAQPLGATLVPGGVNFSIFSRSATAMTLVLQPPGGPAVELPFPETFRIGGCWSMTVFGLAVEGLTYGFRADGPDDGLCRFDPSVVLCDPYARALTGRDRWAPEGIEAEGPRAGYRSLLVFDDFDWDGDAPLRIPVQDLVVYETHVRGFTAHESSGVRHRGTFAGLVEKIPYLVELGVNCVELMPVFEFDEREGSRVGPDGSTLGNYWGYSTVGFFAPKAGLAATGVHGMQVDEFRTLVRALHRAGIEVILDVVFNHTAEGNEQGPTISFRGLDNREYYILGPGGEYYNYSGTGNTFNCNNPVVREFVLDALRYWASECHVDGFRFDLASILGRAPDGTPLPNPPLLETLSYDPILRDCKLIAEAWDAGGLYQVGSFPAYGRWAEWNGRYRDTVRRFLKGDPGQAGALADAMVGSPGLYAARGTTASVNFVTCHDGFTLADLVSYGDKHNEANGEDNRDGANDNDSWNCGAEGPTDDPSVLALRQRQVRNALTLLLTSRGTPMLLGGDEVRRSQGGNNNAYCQDGPVSWMDWALTQEHADLRDLTAGLIALRRAHPALRAGHPTGEDRSGTGLPDVSWHGARSWSPDWGPDSRLVVALLADRHDDGSPDVVLVIANAHWQGVDVELPAAPDGLTWHRAVDTLLPDAAACTPPGQEVPLDHPYRYMTGPRSTVVLVAR